jgi:hypothetical protein
MEEDHIPYPISLQKKFKKSLDIPTPTHVKKIKKHEEKA